MPREPRDLTPAQEDFNLRNREGGVDRYVIREASAAAAKEYRNATSRASRYEDGKFVGLEGIADAEPLLVGLCTFSVDEKGGASKKPVGLEIVLAWPDRIQAEAYDIVRDISPTLGPETLEAVDRQLARLQRRRAELASANGAAPDPNAPPPPGGGTSASADV